MSATEEREPLTWAERKELDHQDKLAARNPDGQPASYAGGRPVGVGKPLGRRAVRRALIFGHYGQQPKRSRCQRLERKPRTGGWK